MTVIKSSGTGGQGTDHHSGWKKILDGQTVLVAENKQMVVFGTLENDGSLHVDGELILED
jgi:hypothetical protein